MKTFMIIANVNGIDYLTKVDAESNAAAEHKVLDLSYCGRHDYGVTACMACDAAAMRTDCFIMNALAATPVDFEKLTQIIEARNAEIREHDEAEKRVEQIEKQMKELEKRLADAKAILAAK